MVILTCTKEYFDADKVEFLNIEEDMSGGDLMTFKCPKCNEIHKSYILG